MAAHSTEEPREKAFPLGPGSRIAKPVGHSQGRRGRGGKRVLRKEPQIRENARTRDTVLAPFRLL